jgi:hypothetical protein
MRDDHDTGPIERLLRDDHARLDTLNLRFRPASSG